MLHDLSQLITTLKRIDKDLEGVDITNLSQDDLLEYFIDIMVKYTALQESLNSNSAFHTLTNVAPASLNYTRELSTHKEVVFNCKSPEIAEKLRYMTIDLNRDIRPKEFSPAPHLSSIVQVETDFTIRIPHDIFNHLVSSFLSFSENHNLW